MFFFNCPRPSLSRSQGGFKWLMRDNTRLLGCGVKRIDIWRTNQLRERIVYRVSRNLARKQQMSGLHMSHVRMGYVTQAHVNESKACLTGLIWASHLAQEGIGLDTSYHATSGAACIGLISCMWVRHVKHIFWTSYVCVASFFVFFNLRV